MKNSVDIGDVEYFHYDFHKNKIENLHLILKGTDQFIYLIEYYKENLKTKQVLKYQKGVIRTNWMDCLDRTNFAQTKMYMYSLQNQLMDSGVDLATIFNEPDFEKMGLAFADIGKDRPIVSLINNMWADNGDFISLQYTGTNSTITRVMKEGKKGILSSINHKYQDVHRFVNNNFTDNFKEEWIRMIIGRSKRSKAIASDDEWDVDETLPNFKVSVFTWNLGATKPESVEELKQSIFNDFDVSQCDIIAFNFQEIVKLNISNVLNKNSNNEAITHLISILQDTIKEDYILVHHVSLVGMLTLVFIHK